MELAWPGFSFFLCLVQPCSFHRVLNLVAGKAISLLIPLQWSRKLLAAHKFVRNGKEEDDKHQ